MRIKCGTCEGEGLVVIGYEPDTRLDQGDPIEATCPVCQGRRSVPLSAFHSVYYGVWPDADDACKILEAEAETMQLSKGGQ